MRLVDADGDGLSETPVERIVGHRERKLWPIIDRPGIGAHDVLYQGF